MAKDRPACVGGCYEIGVGVDDLATAIGYFERCGYRVGPVAHFTAAKAKALYGHGSALTAVRLLHQSADHGLIRLMKWEKPANAGIGMEGFRCEGNRWGAALTRNVMAVSNHAENAHAMGRPVKVVEPVFAVIYPTGKETEPFREEIIGVREMMLVQPLYRQIFFERFGYDNPLYGQVNEASLLRLSQVTHAGMVVRSDDPGILNFYDHVLGLKRSADHEVPYVQSKGSRPIFELEKGETHWLVDFDDPQSGAGAHDRRSGRLKIIRFAKKAKMPDVHDRSRPGALGYCLYSWRCTDAKAMRAAVMAGGASDVTRVQEDEFGAKAFSFRAPDGYFWTLIEA